MLLWKRKKEADPSVVKIARQEWTGADMEFLSSFLKSNTFKKFGAVMDGYLVQQLLRGQSQEFRSGWQTCMKQIAQFELEDADELEDDERSISMQTDLR